MQLLIVILNRGLSGPYGHAVRYPKCQMQVFSQINQKGFQTHHFVLTKDMLFKSGCLFGSCSWSQL